MVHHYILRFTNTLAYSPQAFFGATNLARGTGLVWCCTVGAFAFLHGSLITMNQSLLLSVTSRAFFASPMHGARRFSLGEMVGYPARWTGLTGDCTFGAFEDA
jgi:hypothetical protein